MLRGSVVVIRSAGHRLAADAAQMARGVALTPEEQARKTRIGQYGPAALRPPRPSGR